MPCAQAPAVAAPRLAAGASNTGVWCSAPAPHYVSAFHELLVRVAQGVYRNLVARLCVGIYWGGCVQGSSSEAVYRDLVERVCTGI